MPVLPPRRDALLVAGPPMDAGPLPESDFGVQQQQQQQQQQQPEHHLPRHGSEP
jgi:hypothetical protein